MNTNCVTDTKEANTLKKSKRCGSKRNNTVKKLLCGLFAAVLLTSGCVVPASADEQTAENGSTAAENTDVAEQNYRNLKDSYRFEYYNGEDVAFNARDIVSVQAELVSDIEGFNGNAVKLVQGGEVNFNITVPQDGQYKIAIEYYDASESTLPVNCSVAIDDKYTCYEMRNQQFESEWEYETEEFSTDRYGNEIVPESVRISKWQTKYFSDASAITMEPFWFDLSAGTHGLKFRCSQGNLIIGKIILCGDKKQEYGKTGTPEGDECKVLEGERFTSKNSASIRPAGEYDASVEPYNYAKLKLNMLSGASFADGGQSVTYTFNVDKSGYYYLGFKYRQNSKNDFPVFRYMYLDGKLYTEDFKNVAFDYSRDFTTMTVEDSKGNPIGVYLEQNVTHTLTLTVSLENMADIIDDVNTLISEINDVSLQLMKVTGNNTSSYRDFDVLAYIPTIQDDLNGWAERIEDIYSRLGEFAPEVKTIGEYSTLEICIKQLRSLAEDIANLPNRIDELYQGDSSVGQYLANTLESLYTSPLTIDQIYIYQDEEKLPESKGFFYKMGMSFMRFLSSFTSEYSTGSDDDTPHLEVWVNRSRLYIELMQKMADNGFYGETGMAVDISIMPNEEKLVLASASGNVPDVALGVTYTIPFELAIRGAIKELSTYPDWQEVASRFGKGIINIGAVDGGYYLLPETSDFLVLFYREDILDELGLSVPDTMEEVKLMRPVLKRYGMDFYSHIAGHPGTKTLSVLVPFIYQMNGRVYGETATDLRITSEETVAAFTEMRKLFTIYDIPYEVSNFYQHFRSGSIPIGISGFNTYMTLLNSAPEIANSWSVAPYPGYADENGNVLRYISGAQSTAIIFDDTEYSEESWEFLKWWTGTEVQSEFAETLRLTYGNEYMWNTANLEAFAQLPWNEEHKATILEMMDWIVEVPRIPGNYMTQRSLSNALNNVVLTNSNVRQELSEAEKDIRAEVNSKLEEFGYIKDGKTVKDYKVVEQEGYYEK